MELPNDWLALLALAFVYGARHGLDADHLATIDGLTRFNQHAAPARARWCGALFSLGHGSIVIGVALVVGFAAERWDVPAAMDYVGTWISISFLTLLGVLNLHAVFATPAHSMVAPVGLKAGFFKRLQSASHPLAIAAVGALFALSFDTMSQAALFSITASRQGGLAHALALGLAFTFGMLLADGANGLWIGRLLSRSDQRARVVSRVMGLMVGVISLGVAGLGLVRHLNGDIAGWYEGREAGIGIAVIALLTATYTLGLWLASRTSVNPVLAQANQ